MPVAEKWFRLAARLLVRQARTQVEEYVQDLTYAIQRLQEQISRVEAWFQIPLPGAERKHFALLWEDQV